MAGLDVARDPVGVRSRLGYLPESNPLYLDMSVARFLQFVGHARRIDRAKMKPAIDRVIASCGLQEVFGRTISQLSKGFRQRVGLARALLHDPDLLILDEPTGRPRSQPSPRDPRFVGSARQGKDRHPLDPHPPGGAGRVHARDHHRARQEKWPTRRSRNCCVRTAPSASPARPSRSRPRWPRPRRSRGCRCDRRRRWIRASASSSRPRTRCHRSGRRGDPWERGRITEIGRQNETLEECFYRHTIGQGSEAPGGFPSAPPGARGVSLGSPAESAA